MKEKRKYPKRRFRCQYNKRMRDIFLMKTETEVIFQHRALIIDKIQVETAKDNVSIAKKKSSYFWKHVYNTKSSLKRLRSIM